MRRCGRCGEHKEVGEFAWRRRAKGQLDNYCRPCRAAYKQELYAANRQRYIDQVQVRKREVIGQRVRWLIEFFRSHPCTDCGETDPLVLEFDHLVTNGSPSPTGCGTGTGSRFSTRSPNAT